MEPESPQQRLPAPGTRQRTMIFAGAGILIALVISIVLLLNTGGKKKSDTDTKPPAAKEFRTTYGNVTPTYADNPMYDACGIVSLDTVKKHIKNYDSILAKTGATRKPAADPLTIEHTYVDRDIPAVLGNDGQPRPTGTTVNQDPSVILVNAYTSLFDSNCAYGQGEPLSGSFRGFARVYVTQKPTPLSSDFLAYVSSIDPSHRKDTGGFETYISTTKDKDGYTNAIIMRPDKGMAVMIRAVTPELLNAAAQEAASKLSSPAAGPANVVYPRPYEDLTNPCALLTADQFQQFTGKPAGAMAQETLFLTESDEAFNFADDDYPSVSRTCSRLEIDRTTPDNVAQTKVTIRQFRSNASAKKYVEALRNDKVGLTKIQSLKTRIALGDEAYIKVETQSPAGESPYELEMRVGAAIIAVQVEGDAINDASAEAYEARMLPAAKAVLAQYQE